MFPQYNNAKILSIKKSFFIIIQCDELIYQLFTQKFHMKVLSLFLIEVTELQEFLV